MTQEPKQTRAVLGYSWPQPKRKRERVNTAERQQLSGPASCTCHTGSQGLPLFPGNASSAKHFCCFLRGYKGEGQRKKRQSSQSGNQDEKIKRNIVCMLSVYGTVKSKYFRMKYYASSVVYTIYCCCIYIVQCYSEYIAALQLRHQQKRTQALFVFIYIFILLPGNSHPCDRM